MIHTDEIKPTQTFRFKINTIALVASFAVYIMIILILWIITKSETLVMSFIPLTGMLIICTYMLYKASLIFFNDDITIMYYCASRRKIKYSDVTEINIPGNFLLSYGFSLDTIQVKYGKKKVSFAPNDKKEVLELLKERCPQAKVTIIKK